MPGENVSSRVALVSGATGITGRHLVQHLSTLGWAVHTVARRQLDLEDANVIQHQVDLLKGAEGVAQALKTKGGSASEVTHAFHCAYLTTADPHKDCEINLAMLRALVEGAEGAGCKLRHVFCMSGTKWYGVHFRPGGIDQLKTPHHEDDPRHMPPNFYYDQQDYVDGRVRGGAKWSWSMLRPNPVCGFSRGSFMNLVVSLAVYASVCKELGIAFRFPGTGRGYQVLTEVCDADLLAQAMVHTSTQPQCANQAFNISNGDVFRWCQVWPRIADFFGVPKAEPMHMTLGEVMKDKGAIWDAIVKKHKLKAIPFEQLATWQFVDIVFSQQTDFFSNVNRLRRAGFHGMCIDSGDMFLRHLMHLREIKVIP